jgi:hypothetical protein
VLRPASFPHAFTLKELARRTAQVDLGAVEGPDSARLAALHEGRRTADLLGASPVDDVEDPTGRRSADHETMAREVADLVDQVVAALWAAAGPA